MLTEEQVKANLEEVVVPSVKRSVVSMNLVRNVALSDHGVKITMASTALTEGAQKWVENRTKKVMEKLSEAKTVEVEFTKAEPKELNEIGHIIAIMSGKGGVGKSLVTSLSAIALKRQGYEVGILDADITGPSIPKMFGITGHPSIVDSAIMPVLTRSGIVTISINLLLPHEEEAVIWRGPLIGRVITQFWEDVVWGKLDYLFVDLPPGTADAPLTVMQRLPLSGLIIVFTPQALTTMIVKKAVNMAQKMGKPIVGVVENMSYLYVPELNKKIELFGKSRGEEMAQAAQAPFLGQLPIDPELAKLCDEGNIESYSSEVVDKLGKSLQEAIEAKAKKAG